MLKNVSFLLIFTLLSVCVRAGAAPPPNDDCANATTLVECAASIVGDNHDATIEPSDTIFCGSDENTIWYTYTSSINGSTDIYFSNLFCDNVNQGLQMNVLTGACGGPYTSVQCIIQFTSDSIVSFNATAATQYYFIVDGYAADMCSFDIRVGPTNALLTSISSSNSCVGASNGVADVTVSGGGTPYSFIWSTTETTEDISGLSSGTYTVTVSDAGTCPDQLLSTTVSEPNVPSAITAPMSNINATSADCGGDVYCAGNASVTQRGVCWNTTGNPTTADNITNDGSGTGVYSSTMTGLTEGTYYVRAYAINSSGVGYGEEKSFSNFTTINLPAPVACPTGTGSPVLKSSTTVGASSEPFFGYYDLCYDMFQHNTVIFELIITGNELDITLSNTTITPMVALLKGDATNDSLYIVECSTGLNHTYYNINVGDTVYVVISGSSPSDNGTFDVSFQNNFACNDCVQEDILVASPSPYYGGYKPGETVNFCYSISNYQDLNTSWFHGIAPLFGNGWDTSTLVQTFIPPSCDGSAGTWGWFNKVTSTGTGLTAGPGFFFDHSTSLDGDPGNNYGDNCVNAAADWTFCWSIQARLDTLSGRDLSVEVENYSDGETGSWTDVACVNDANYLINAYMQSPDFLHDTAIVGVLCNGESTGSINLSNFEFGTTAYSFQWSNGATDANISGLAVNTYAVTITDYLEFTTSESYTITEPLAITATTSSISSNCGASDGSVSATASGGTGTLSFLWSTSATTSTVTGLSAAAYAVTVSDINSCTTVTSATVNDIGAGTISVTETDATCNGVCDGVVTTTITGGNPPYNYSWSDGQNSINATGLCAGAYGVTITDGTGCVVTHSGAIIEPPALTLTTSSTSVTCNGGTDGAASANVSGGLSPYSYYWANSSTTASISGLTVGSSYGISVVDANLCTIIDNVTITEPPAIMVSAGAGQNVCADNRIITLTGFSSSSGVSWSSSGTGAFSSTTALNATYTISDADTAIGSVLITLLTTGNAPCSEVSDVMSIGINSVPAIIVSVISNYSGADISCNGSADGVAGTTILGGAAPFNYAWTSSGTGATESGLADGIYSVTVTGGNTCLITKAVTLTEPNILLANLLVDNHETCSGLCDGQATAFPSGGTSGYFYNWDNGSSSQTISGLCDGFYVLTVSDANSCSEIQSAIVDSGATIVATVDPITNQCLGNTFNFDGSGSTTSTLNSLTYNWDFGDANTATGFGPSNTYAVAGTYTVVLTVTDLGCSDITTTNLEVYTNPVLSGGSMIEPTCFGNSNGAINITVTSGTTGYNYLWSNGSPSPNIGLLPTGSYTVTVTDANSCITQGTFNLGQPSVINPNATVDVQESCDAACDGEISSSATGGTSSYSYLWSNLGTTAIQTGLCDGGYTITITDVNGCTASQSVSVSSGTAIVAAFSPVSNQCLTGNSYTFDASGSSSTPPVALTYSWDYGDGNTGTGINPTYSYVTDGGMSVFLTVTDGTCSDVVFNNHTILGEPTITALSVSNISCVGFSDGIINVTVTSGSGLLPLTWSNGATTENISSLAAGVYTLTATSGPSCPTVSSFTITEPTALTITQTCNPTSGVGTSDGSSSVAGSGGSGIYTFLWDNGQTGLLATGLSAGTIIVTTTDSNGCVSIDNCTIVDSSTSCNITLTPSILNPDSCGEGYGAASVGVTGGTSPYNYLWESGNSSSTDNNLFGGANYITITDNGGCVETFTITVPGAGIDSVVVTSTPASCGASDGSVLATVYGGTSPYFYIWLNSNLDSIGTTNVMNNVPAGTYISGVRDVMGCNESGGNFVYNIGSPIPTDISSTDVTCGDSSDGIVSVSVTGGTPPYSYSWQEIDSGNLYSGQTVSGVPQGIYVVTISDSQTPSCAVFAPVGVIGPEPIEAFYDPIPESCVGSIDGAIIPYIYGGTSPYSFAWSNSSTADSLVGIPAGFYSVTITDFIGCQLVDTGSISLLSNLAITGAITQPNCGSSDGSISLFPLGGISGYSFAWNGGSGTNPLQTGVAPGTYNITVTDGIGCTDTISFTLSGGVPISFVAYGYSDTCSAGVGAIQIDSVTGNVGTYEYSLDNINFQTANLFTDLFTDTFMVYVTDLGSCIDSAQVIIGDTLFDVEITFTVIPDTICAGDEATVTASGGNQFNWLTESSTANFVSDFIDSSTFFVVEVSLGNCSAIDSIQVIALSAAECWNSNVDPPNAFSPDGDGTNDTWIIAGIESTENTVIIFNRWGDYIAEFTNYDNQSTVWDGTNSSGDELPTETYFYVIEIDGVVAGKDWIQIVR